MLKIQYFFLRADKLQRLADKINRDIRQTEKTLEDVEIRIDEESRRIDRLHPQVSIFKLDDMKVKTNKHHLLRTNTKKYIFTQIIGLYTT